MRKAGIGLLVLAVLSVGLAPGAAAAPPGVMMWAGNLRDKDRGALYVRRQDASGQPLCAAECSAALPPFLAPPGAKAEGLWTIVTTAKGERQWAYDGEPLYVRSPLPSEPDLPGDLVLPARIRNVVDEGFAVLADDLSVGIRPRATSRTLSAMMAGYPSASLRAEEQGTVHVSMCVDMRGVPFNVKVKESSGFVRLDNAAVRALPGARLLPATGEKGEAIAVCGHDFEVVWVIPGAQPFTPASPTQTAPAKPVQ